MTHINFLKREMHIFITAIFFICAISLYNFIFKPGIKKWQAVNSEIEVKKARMNKGIELIQKRDVIMQEYNKYAKSTKNISKILNYIEGLADSLGIKTSNIKPGQEMERDFYKEYSIELQIEGGMQDITKFFLTLAKLPTFVTLKKCNFRSASEDLTTFKGTIILSKILI